MGEVRACVPAKPHVGLTPSLDSYLNTEYLKIIVPSVRNVALKETGVGGRL